MSRLRSVGAVAEPLLALAAAALVTLALSLPFMPLELRLELPLTPAGDGEPRWTPDRVAELARADGLAESVSVVEDGEELRLRLSGVSELAPTVRALRALLDGGGYAQTRLRTTPDVDLGRLLREDPRLLPKVLSIQAGVFFCAGLLLARLRLADRSVRRRAGVWGVLLFGLGGGGLAILLSAVLSLMLRFMGWPVEEQAWLQDLLGDREQLWLLAPWVVLIVPAAEEVFFRGYVFRFVTERLGFQAGLWISSAIFAAVHLNPSGVPLYLVIALVMAWIYRRTGRLSAAVLAHATLNGFVLLAGAFVP